MVTRIVNSLLVWAVMVVMTATTTSAYEWSSSAGSRPEVNRRAIAGIWKLTPTTAKTFPMKEFTVYPKKPRMDQENDFPELLLVLKEDGSFQQCDEEIRNNNDNQKFDVDSSWKKFQQKQHTKQQHQLRGLMKGTWDYIDGNLILAADRPEQQKSCHALADGYNQRSHTETLGLSENTDTILKGQVVASYQTQLVEDKHPILLEESPTQQTNATTTSQQSGRKTTALDTHLLVPKGSINIGKFFYPKHHPSFFEQPMFQPVKKGTFTLRQVLGSLNTARDQLLEQDMVERFQQRDFYNKTFLLTSYSLKQKKTQSNKNRPQEDITLSSSTTNIRVMQVAFHANNTFSSIAGLGESVILRGKFDVIGKEKNQLWMQIMRFGFGRSVSGSVYSEGRMLTHDDAKTYWGTITVQGEPVGKYCKPGTQDNIEQSRRLEVKGSVLVGWGLEPLPVASFIMRESRDKLQNRLEEEEEVEIDHEQMIENIIMTDNEMDQDGIDWLTDQGGMFQ